jgi:ribonuclease Z
LSFKITILGSSSATISKDRGHSSHLVQLENIHLLIDCGEATQIQLKKFGFKASKLSHIYISHLHGDHYLGLIGLLLSLNLHKRKEPINLYAPPELMDILVVNFKFSDSKFNFPINFFATNNQSFTCITDEKKFLVYSFPLKHRIHCTGFLIKEKSKPRKLIAEKVKNLPPNYLKMLKQGLDIIDKNGNVIIKNEDVTYPVNQPKAYAYCSDTIFYPEICQYIKGVDLLYHEATFLEEHKDRANETYHCTAKQAATIAKQAGVKKLVIGHFSPRYKDTNRFIQEASSIFEHTYIANDGDTYVL